MTVSLVIQDFEQLSQSGAYGGMRRLSPQTELMLISLYQYASNYRWSNQNGEPLTDEQRNTIENWVSVAQDELMNEVQSTMPLGSVIAIWTQDIPPGTLLCDGSVYNRSDYPDLYEVLVPDLQITASTFLVPLLNNNYIRATGILSNVNTTVGNDFFSLTIAQMPPHTHSYARSSGSGPAQAGTGFPASTNIVGGFNTNSRGSGAQIDNRPSSIRARYVMIATT